MTEKLDFKAEYEKYRKKHNLPDFDTLHKEFELGDLEKKDFPLRVLRRKMRDKLIFFCRILEGILYPTERSPLSSYESSFFNEDARTTLTKMHSAMMIFDRQSMLLDIEGSEDKDVEYILKLWKQWPTFKQDVANVVRTMEESWKTTIKEETEHYFG
ncbi:MAG TPA: hypothetical protein VFE88_01665 [Candidatus Nanoarchaeia archaeon]|nr:hypothetical protein [Candidatus Nanoarchaeia archaeon]